MIRTKEIRKSFGTLEVLKGIDLLVERGEVVSIVGPSGAGKTTLLQILGTLSRPSSGEIEIDGEAVHAGSSRASAIRKSASFSSSTICCPSSRRWKTSAYRVI